MTFLLFLVSVAVLEYILRESGRKATNIRSKPDPIHVWDTTESESISVATATSDLLALEQALNRQTTNQTTDVKGVTDTLKG